MVGRDREQPVGGDVGQAHRAHLRDGQRRLAERRSSRESGAAEEQDRHDARAKERRERAARLAAASEEVHEHADRDGRSDRDHNGVSTRGNVDTSLLERGDDDADDRERGAREREG